MPPPSTSPEYQRPVTGTTFLKSLPTIAESFASCTFLYMLQNLCNKFLEYNGETMFHCSKSKVGTSKQCLIWGTGSLVTKFGSLASVTQTHRHQRLSCSNVPPCPQRLQNGPRRRSDIIRLLGRRMRWARVKTQGRRVESHESHTDTKPCSHSDNRICLSHSTRSATDINSMVVPCMGWPASDRCCMDTHSSSGMGLEPATDPPQLRQFWPTITLACI